MIGGGSFQWVPKLVCDLVNTPALAEAELVLEDISAAPLADMGDLARHLVARAGVPMRVTTTTDALGTATYGYDAGDQLTGKTDRLGRQVTFTPIRDPAGVGRRLRIEMCSRSG